MQIEITVTNRECKITGAADTLVCDNSGDTLHFVFDAEWSGYAEKIVYFVEGYDGRHYRKLMSGDTVEIPVLTAPGHLIVGVQAGNIRTTRDVVVDVKPSIQTRLTRPAAEPAPSLTAQIMERMDELEERIGEGGNGEGGGVTLPSTDKLLKGNGSGGAVPATAGVDYATPAQVGEKYTKPDGGIPETDLAEAVKAKLNREESDPTVPAWAKEPTKPSYTAAEVGALPASTTVPAPVQKTSGMTQAVGMDSNGRLWTAPGSSSGGTGGITEETDPTVPDWAKSPTKPTYTAAEVGALPSSTVIPTTLADLAGDSTHRTVTDAEKTAWNGKQAAISDLDTIRSGASAGASAYQKPSSGIPKTDLASAVQTSLGKADTALQSSALNSYRTAADQDTRDNAKQTKTIADPAGYFTTNTVEGALAEIGAELSGINTLLGSGVIA